MNPKIERLKDMAAELRLMFPGLDPQLQAHSDGRIDLSVWADVGYAVAESMLRDLGIGKRHKQAHDPEKPWFVLAGNADGVKVNFFGKGFPTSCCIETYTKKLPKQQTVDTGEFIEVSRTRIVCGEKEGA